MNSRKVNDISLMINDMIREDEVVDIGVNDFSELRDLGNDNFKLIVPILIEFDENAKGQIIAYFLEGDMFALGSSKSEAVKFLKKKIVQRYNEIDRMKNESMKIPQQEIDFLKILRYYLEG